MDQRQFAGEDMAAALNVQQPVPMQKPYVQLDPIYRMNYNDVRNTNTAAFRDMLRQNQGNPAADALAFGRFAQQNQSIGGEEFRTNQAIEQAIYSGNRAKMNANLEKGIALNIDQANKQSIAKSKTDERNIEIAKSRADKENLEQEIISLSDKQNVQDIIQQTVSIPEAQTKIKQFLNS